MSTWVQALILKIHSDAAQELPDGSFTIKQAGNFSQSVYSPCISSVSLECRHLEKPSRDGIQKSEALRHCGDLYLGCVGVSLYEQYSKLLASALPLVVPYIVPCITPFKEFRVWLICVQTGDRFFSPARGWVLLSSVLASGSHMPNDFLNFVEGRFLEAKSCIKGHLFAPVPYPC